MPQPATAWAHARSWLSGFDWRFNLYIEYPPDTTADVNHAVVAVNMSVRNRLNPIWLANARFFRLDFILRINFRTFSSLDALGNWTASHKPCIWASSKRLKYSSNAWGSFDLTAFARSSASLSWAVCYRVSLASCALPGPWSLWGVYASFWRTMHLCVFTYAMAWFDSTAVSTL